MKAKKKPLAYDLAIAIEAKLGEVTEQPKKFKKTIEKSTDKLAKKLVKLLNKEEKKQKSENKADTKPKKLKKVTETTVAVVEA